MKCGKLIRWNLSCFICKVNNEQNWGTFIKTLTSIGPYLSRTPNIFSLLHNFTNNYTTALLYTGWLRVESTFYGLFLTFKIDPYCHFLFRVSFQNVSWLIRVLRNGMSAVYSWLSLMSNCFLKFLYSEKATKVCKIITSLLSYVLPVKSKVKISQNFMAFSEYMNFILVCIFVLFTITHIDSQAKFGGFIQKISVKINSNGLKK